MKIVMFAGGVGSRLWPLSRKNAPKQFEKIIGDKSTLQLAADRLQPDFPWDNLYVSTANQYIDIVRSQLSQIPKEHIIGEPIRRDVGPAVGLMTAILAKEAPFEPMAILWSDHLVKKEEHFRKILLAAGEIVAEDPNKVVFVAQKPRFASQNLGWIHYGEKVAEKNNIALFSFRGFKYRPDSQTAEKYFKSGQHAWNLGYFVTTPQFLLEKFKSFVPDLYIGVTKIADAWGTNKFDDVLNEVYPTLQEINFDNAVLENLDAKDALIVSENIDWSDIGAWEALKEALSDHDEQNITKGEVVVEDCIDTLAYNFTNQFVVGIDLKNMIVVNTKDVVLVCPKDSVPKIKKFVEKLKGTDLEHLT